MGIPGSTNDVPARLHGVTVAARRSAVGLLDSVGGVVSAMRRAAHGADRGAPADLDRVRNGVRIAGSVDELLAIMSRLHSRGLLTAPRVLSAAGGDQGLVEATLRYATSERDRLAAAPRDGAHADGDDRVGSTLRQLESMRDLRTVQRLGVMTLDRNGAQPFPLLLDGRQVLPSPAGPRTGEEQLPGLLVERYEAYVRAVRRAADASRERELTAFLEPLEDAWCLAYG